MRGLGGTQVSLGQALVLEPAKQVHTFGMSYPIDVLYCDRRWVIEHVVRNLSPQRVTKIVSNARYAIELAGSAIPDNIAVGDELRVWSGVK